MDFPAVSQLLRERLAEFLQRTGTPEPPCSWSSGMLCELLRQYPAGLSEAVLLTELEARWRASRRRGEHAGKLLQVLTSLQLSASDVLLGEVTTIGGADSGRYIMQSGDGGKVEILLNEQFSDFISFTKHEGMSLLLPTALVNTSTEAAGRPIRLTQCNLLNSPPLPMMLLTSPIGILEMSTDSAQDTSILSNSFTSIHNDTYGILTDVDSNSLVDMNSIANMMTGVYALVLSVSETLQYPGRSVDSYRAVKLHVPGLFEETTVNRRSHFIYLILYESQCALGDLLITGEMIYLFRPLILANKEESNLFGGCKVGSQSHESFAYYDVQRVAAPLAADYASQSDNRDVYMSPLKSVDRQPCSSLHFLVGSLSCIIGVQDSSCKLMASISLRKLSGRKDYFRVLDFKEDSDDHVKEVTGINAIPRTMYSSLMLKYSLKLDDYGNIDALKVKEPVALSDILPGLINLSIFARIIFIDHSSQQGGTSCAMWLLVLPPFSDENCRLMYLKCNASNLQNIHDRSFPQIGSIVYVSGVRVESSQLSLSTSPIALPPPVSRYLNRRAVVDETFLVSSVAYHEEEEKTNAKNHGLVLNTSCFASVVTSPGIFRPLLLFEELQELYSTQGNENTKSWSIVWQSRIAHAQFYDEGSVNSPDNHMTKRARTSETSENASRFLYDVALVPSHSQPHFDTDTHQNKLCRCLSCNELPHIHALVTTLTLSLASSVDFTSSSLTGNIFEYSHNMDYIVSMSRIDDIITESDCKISHLNGPVYRMDCIADVIAKK